MSDTDRIDALETQIEDLETQLGDLRVQLAKAELDQWRARIDDLEVQVHLASMDAGDAAAPLVEELRNKWLEAKAGLVDTASVATDVADSLRKGLEQAMSDIRRALLEAKSTATR